jgi:hypothetical protein
MGFLNYRYYVGGTQPRNYRVVNNTLYGNTNAFRLDGFCEDAIDLVFANNIAYGTTDNSLWGESEDCSTGMSKSNYDFDYNLYGQSGNFGRLYTSTFSFTTWQSSTYDNQDTNGFYGVDPLFVNASGGDFRLQAGSPVRNAVIDLLDLDRDGSITDFINAGAYITGNEIIGTGGTGGTGGISAPTNLRVVPSE